MFDKGRNSCTIRGNLGSDAEVTFTQNGNQFIRFSVAVTESWRDKNTDQWQEETTWVPVKCFAKGDSKLPQYLVKGAKVEVNDGKFKTECWEKDDGSKSYSSFINAYSSGVTIIASPGDRQPSSQGPVSASSGPSGSNGPSAPSNGGAATTQPQGDPAPPIMGNDFDDDIPF